MGDLLSKLLFSELSEIPRLSRKEAVILQLLGSSGELYGLELVASSQGQLKRGTVYVTLSRMEEKGYVEARQTPAPEGAGGLPRRRYRATAAGQLAVQALERALSALQPAEGRS
jgi:DNA-binding PadR family transcriptional regulator